MKTSDQQEGQEVIKDQSLAINSGIMIPSSGP